MGGGEEEEPTKEGNLIQSFQGFLVGWWLLQDGGREREEGYVDICVMPRCGSPIRCGLHKAKNSYMYSQFTMRNICTEIGTIKEKKK